MGSVSPPTRRRNLWEKGSTGCPKNEDPSPPTIIPPKLWSPPPLPIPLKQPTWSPSGLLDRFTPRVLPAPSLTVTGGDSVFSNSVTRFRLGEPVPASPFRMCRTCNGYKRHQIALKKPHPTRVGGRSRDPAQKFTWEMARDKCLLFYSVGGQICGPIWTTSREHQQENTYCRSVAHIINGPGNKNMQVSHPTVDGPESKSRRVGGGWSIWSPPPIPAHHSHLSFLGWEFSFLLGPFISAQIDCCPGPPPVFMPGLRNGCDICSAKYVCH